MTARVPAVEAGRPGSEYLWFESRALRQSHRSGNSLGLSKREKNALYQRHLPEWLGTTPLEAHLPSLFGRFLRRLGTAPI
jgi:hypothetical protein